MKYLICLLAIGAICTSCIPKTQYQALETERNYYRNQSALADSMNDLRAIQTYDQVDNSGNELDLRIRQVEGLTATNIALNNSYQSLQTRYEELLTQSKGLLLESGTQVTGLQQNLANRTTQVAEKEAELRQKELDLQAREESIARIEGDYTPAGGGEPTSYGVVTAPTAGRPALSGAQNASLTLNNIQTDMNQLLANNLQGNTYVIAPAGSNRLQISLAERVLSDDGFTISVAGQNLLRRVAGMLRNYPSAEIYVTGHSDGDGSGNALRAYEDSTDKAINVAQQLVTYGMDPGKITAGGKGFYDPIGSNATPEGQAANQRMDIFVVIPQ